MLLRHTALVSLSPKVSFADVTRIAAALQIQATRDFTPIHHIAATVTAYPDVKSVPDRYWTMTIEDLLDQPGAAGYHADENGQPYARIQTGQTLNDTCLTASHEFIEMIVDPFGNEMVQGDPPKGQEKLGRCMYLKEACDPPEDSRFAYQINGLLVSDFLTPDFYAPSSVKKVKGSFTGAITTPRTILRGGYISFIAADGKWRQQTWFNGPKIKTTGPLDWKLGRDGKTWREISDAHANSLR